MTGAALGRRRLAVQQITRPRHGDPADVVRALCAVQAQDYPASLWAIGLRTRGGEEVDVERAIAERAFVRTWPMRRTLHFVPAGDVRWLLALLGPRQIAASGARLRQLDLDERVFARARRAVEHALAPGTPLARPDLYRALEERGIPTHGQRGIHVVARLAQEGVLCFATRAGKQPTFALLDAWVPRGRMLAREEALAELATRYFTGHGPATLQDFAWWTGLRAPDARAAVELARPALAQETVAGRVHWRSPARVPTAAARTAHLLPAFDELLVGYRDRSAILSPAHAPRIHHLLSPTIVLRDRVVGTWTRSLANGRVLVRATFFTRPAPPDVEAVAAAADRYARFLGRGTAADLVVAPAPR